MEREGEGLAGDSLAPGELPLAVPQLAHVGLEVDAREVLRAGDALAAEARLALARLPHANRAHLVLTAHSLPLEHIAAGDPYVEQLRATVAGVLGRLPGHDWSLAYQSKGMGQGEWLEPPAETVLEGLARDGVTDVALLPVGFNADHVETLYDIDVLIAGKARSLGLAFQRAAAPNTAPLFIAALAAAVRRHL